METKRVLSVAAPQLRGRQQQQQQQQQQRQSANFLTLRLTGAG